jgi:serine protease AprX
VNVAAAKEAITNGYEIPRPPVYTPPIRVTDPRASIESDDSVERGLALTILAKQGQCSRAELWEYARDESPVVRKVAVWALQKPSGLDERRLFWEHLDAEVEGGVRGWWVYGLLQDSSKEEVELWMHCTDDTNWTVRWCISEFLAKYPEFPELEKTFDPELIEEKALPVLRWYEQYKRESGS